VTHPLEDRVGLVEGTLSGLDDGDTVLSVTDGDVEATDLRAQALGDRQTRGVVGRTVDTETAGQLLEGGAQVVLRVGEVAVRVHRRHVVLHGHSHGGVPLLPEDQWIDYPSMGGHQVSSASPEPS